MQYDMTEARQNRIQSFAFVIAASTCVFFSICFVVSGLTGSESAVGRRPAGKIRLDEKINPNDAPVASLVRLPGIGISRAGEIVTYRENFVGKDSNRPAFRDYDDLQKVSGIGPKTVENISEWLRFE